jgi:hypothetical protein
VGDAPGEPPHAVHLLRLTELLVTLAQLRLAPSLLDRESEKLGDPGQELQVVGVELAAGGAPRNEYAERPLAPLDRGADSGRIADGELRVREKEARFPVNVIHQDRFVGSDGIRGEASGEAVRRTFASAARPQREAVPIGLELQYLGDRGSELGHHGSGRLLHDRVQLDVREHHLAELHRGNLPLLSDAKLLLDPPSLGVLRRELAVGAGQLLGAGGLLVHQSLQTGVEHAYDHGGGREHQGKGRHPERVVGRIGEGLARHGEVVRRVEPGQRSADEPATKAGHERGIDHHQLESGGAGEVNPEPVQDLEHSYRANGEEQAAPLPSAGYRKRLASADLHYRRPSRRGVVPSLLVWYTSCMCTAPGRWYRDCN